MYLGRPRDSAAIAITAAIISVMSKPIGHSTARIASTASFNVIPTAHS
jgi:hypothetical protein